MAPLFSVIIPTYNRCALLPRAIDSVLNQTHPDWELVVVDDGSTDATREAVAAYQHPKIRYVYQTNQQLSAARNTGMREASGRYFCFLDDDDVFQPNHLAVLARAMKTTNHRFGVYRSGTLHRRDGKEITQRQFSNQGDALIELWKAPVGQFGMVFSQAITSIQFDVTQLLLEDFTWLTKVLSEHTLHQTDEHTAVMLFHGGQRSYSYLTDELLRNNLSYLKQTYQLPGVADRVPKNYYHNQIVHQYTHYCRQLIRAGRRSAAAKYFAEAVPFGGWQSGRDLLTTAAKLLLPGRLA